MVYELKPEEVKILHMWNMYLKLVLNSMVMKVLQVPLKDRSYVMSSTS